MSGEAIDKWFDDWFAGAIGKPTLIQQQAWPVLRERRNALLLAPTGQGKSLAAWRPVVERMAAGAEGSSRVAAGVRALHIAPLKALARDMTLNLAPLLDFAGRLRGCPIEIALRCGDTGAAERARHRRQPPEILSTTPESLFVLLGSTGGRRMLRNVETVVVDELHALVPSKRGAHLALSLARLDELVGSPVQRIGLSATARPAAMLADFLAGGAECAVIAPDPPGAVELRLELPEIGLGPYPNTLHWQQIHARIAALAVCSPDQRSTTGEGSSAPTLVPGALASIVYPGYECCSGESDSESSAGCDGDAGAACPPRSLLVFCQTRAQVERTASALDELLGEASLPGQVGAHHGSLDTAHREQIEARFKAGELRVLVSSASLELGLDLGHVDRVCQIGAPGSINLVRQRAGRSGHRPGGRPCMHLFPLTLNQLIEAAALADALECGEMDAVEPPPAPLDVLAQHLVAMVAAGEGDIDALLTIVRGAWPYQALTRDRIESLLCLLAEPVQGMPAQQVRTLIQRDPAGGYRPGPNAQALVLVNAGVIPEFFEYEVVRADDGRQVGWLDEEFAFESSPGQVIQLGHRAWRILVVGCGQVRVEPAGEEPPNLPFWFGEGAGRTPEMAEAMLACLAGTGTGSGHGRLHPAASAMLAEAAGVLGALPCARRLIIERFADPGGDRHIVLHTFAGARINRAWGLALRKRFCRQFNFELQAAATDDGILISLGVTSSFELADVVGFVRSGNVADVLIQALLDTPLFVTRFRWCANNALILLKNELTGRIPAQRQRSQAENLIACVFPDQLACLENLAGPRRVPDHPLVQQALAGCLHDYMDLPGLERLLARIEHGEIEIHAVETGQPSPLAQALIHAPRHSYLDDAAAEERRTRNFEKPAAARAGNRPRRTKETSAPASAPVAAASVPGRQQAAGLAAGIARRRPSPDELERLLLEVGFLTAAEGEAGLGVAGPVPAGGWSRHFTALVRDKRALTVAAGRDSRGLWIAAERAGWFMELDPALEFRPWISASLVAEAPGDADTVLAWLIEARKRIEGDNAADTVRRLLGLAQASEKPAQVTGISD